jgi:DNA polymerase-3 subunit delta'
MSLRPIYGHRTLLDRLGGALASSRFPQAALFVGQPGVGKQRLALWTARGLLCERGPGAPCGECISCRQVNGLGHPDLHWFVPITRPKSGDPSKQVEEARDTLGQAMEERRGGLWQPPEGMTSHSLASVRLLQRSVWVTPFAGDRKVFVLGDAERLVVQESSMEAANALLKVLEEPPADTTVIVTSSDPHALLPTVRSRLSAIRVPRVSDEDVRAFLTKELDPPVKGQALERRTLLAEGSIGRAQRDEDDAQGPERAAAALLDAVRTGEASWLPLALAQAPWQARGTFTGMLDALAVSLRKELKESVERERPNADSWVRALERVEATREAAQANVNPQLALASLASELEELL